MSIFILNGTSAQLGYIVPCSCWKIQDRRQIKNADNTETRTVEQSYSGSVASYDTRPGNEVGLFYTTPKPWLTE